MVPGALTDALCADLVIFMSGGVPAKLIGQFGLVEGSEPWSQTPLPLTSMTAWMLVVPLVADVMPAVTVPPGLLLVPCVAPATPFTEVSVPGPLAMLTRMLRPVSGTRFPLASDLRTSKERVDSVPSVPLAGLAAEHRTNSAGLAAVGAAGELCAT